MELSKVYGDLSNTHHADNTDLEALQKLIDRVHAWERGSNTDKTNIGGGAPIIAISAPAGLAMRKAQGQVLTSSLFTTNRSRLSRKPIFQ